MSCDDREIQNLFRNLRREDAHSAPSFERLASGRQTASSGWPGIRTAAVAFAALFALTAGWLLVNRPDPQLAPGLGQALSQWQSPTGFLMNFSGDSVLKGQPILDLPAPPAQRPEKKESNP